MKDVRWRAIADRFRAEIESGRLKEGDRIPASTALAETEGVSRLTAHRAVEELQRLGLVTRDGRRGTVVAPKKRETTRRIALLLDQVDFEHSFPRPELLAGIHEGLGKDYDLVIADAKADPAREIELLNRLADETDGILCWPTDGSRAGATIDGLVARGIPLVLLDRMPREARAATVMTDGAEATRHAMEFLQARGHRRIALLTFDKPDVCTVTERIEAFVASGGSPEAIRRLPASLEVADRAYLEEAVADALFRLARSPEPATALLCVQDLLGFAALEAAAQLEVAIPDALEIVTFNDWPPSWLRRPWQAHRIAFQPGEMGRVALRLLRAQLDGVAGEPKIHRIPAKFVPADGGLAASPDLLNAEKK